MKKLLLMTLIAVPVFGAAPQVTLSSTGASATVAPNSKTAWLCWWNKAGSRTLYTGTFLLSDDDGNGAVSSALAGTTPVTRGICAAADMSTGEIGFARFGTDAEFGALPRGTVMRDASGAMTNIVVEENATLLWLRPGGGAWHWGASPAADSAENARFYTTAGMAPLSGVAAPAGGFARGDVLLALMIDSGDVYGSSVNGDLDTTNPGRISLDLYEKPLEVTEGGALAGRLVRAGGADGTVSVRLTAKNGSAASGLDFQPLDSVITFGPGELTKSFSVSTINDDVYASERSFTVELSNPVSATLGGITVRDFTIHENDPAPLIAFGSVQSSIAETNAPWTLKVPVVLTGKTRIAAEVGYSISSDRFGRPSGKIVLQPGQTTATIDIPINANDLSERDENLTITFTAPKHVQYASTPLQVKIVDDDLPRLVVNERSAAENSAFSFQPSIVGEMKSGSSYKWSTSDGTAIAGIDYVATSGSSGSFLNITLINDQIAEGPETFYLDFTEITAMTMAVTRVKLTILDNDGPASVVAIESATVNEGASGTTTIAKVPLRVSAASPVAIVATVYVNPGTAGSADFTSANMRQVTIPAGALTADLEITIIGDDVDEPDESVNLELAHVTNATRGTPVNATLSIRDDDSGTAAYLSVDNARVSEGTGGTTNARFRVELSAAQTGSVSTHYTTSDLTATAGADYTTTTGKITFASGETVKFIDVPVNGDAITEPTESFALTLYSPVGASYGRQVAEGVILDDDFAGWPQLTMQDIRVNEGNDGTTAARFTLTLSHAPAQPVRVSVATFPGTAASGGDYQPQSSLVTFAAGETTRTVVVQIIGDRTDENDETFELRLSSPEGLELVHDRAVCTIVNDDGVPARLTIGDVNTVEGNSGWSVVRLAVTLAPAQTSEVRVDYATSSVSAQPALDYEHVSDTLVFAAGETVKMIDLRIWGDTVNEPDEVVRVTLSNPVGATLQRASTDVTIVNDDGPQPALPTFTMSDVTMREGDGGWKAIDVPLTLERPLATPVRIDVQTFAITATEHVDFESLISSFIIPANQTSINVVVRIAGDALQESDETFEVRVVAVDGLRITDDRAVVTIDDDDAPAGRRRSVRH